MDKEPSYIFTSTNVAGPGYDKDPDEVVFEGCRCGAPSCGNQCPCIIRFGPNYDKNGRLMKVEEASVDKQRSDTKPIVECNAMCECGERCSNRIVQNGPKFELEVFTTLEKGFGLRACVDIPKSSFVCEYAGEILSKVEAQRRTKLLGDDDPNYILVVREFMKGGKLVETIIDPTYRGNKGRFINHSCEPNLSKVPVRVHNDIPKVALFSLSEIHQGEELTYSYGEETSVYNEDGRKRKPCHCGSKSCRQYLPFDRSLLS